MPRIFRQPHADRLSSTPPLKLNANAAPIPSRIASSVQTAGASISSAVSNASSSITNAVSSTASPKHAVPSKGRKKKNFFKSIGEAIVNFTQKVFSLMKKPFILIKEFFSEKMKPVKHEDSSSTKSSPVKRSLIDEYMKEYERQRK